VDISGIFTWSIYKVFVLDVLNSVLARTHGVFPTKIACVQARTLQITDFRRQKTHKLTLESPGVTTPGPGKPFSF
jgi:hypothetical protein